MENLFFFLAKGNLLETKIWNRNTVSEVLIALGTFAAAMIVLYLFRFLILRQLKRLSSKTNTDVDDFIVSLCEKSLIPVLYLGAFCISVYPLKIPKEYEVLLGHALKIVVLIQIVRFVMGLMTYVVNRTVLRSETKASTASKSILTVIRIAIWGVVFVFVLDNLGFDVNSVVAGLGIGGIAVAMAAQTILGDLFNYFVIFFDKPFREGDFVIVDDYMGVIEHAGIKSTRIRSLGGEQLVFSNSDLTGSRLRNYKRMHQRRVVFSLGVTYQTKLNQMKDIPELLKSIVEGVEDTRFDRAHFKDYGNFSMNFEIVYYVIGADYNQYMDIQQNINLQILKAFEERGIEFAYPTQTLFVNKS